jgi:DNA-binding PadR family transcriptional regulator
LKASNLRRKRDELQKKILLVMLASEESTRLMLQSSKQTGQLDPLAYSMQIKAIIVKLARIAEMWGCKAADELILKYTARESAIERALRQLCMKGLVACHWSRRRGKVRISYTLTEEGKLLAKKFRFEEKVGGLKREGKLEDELKKQLEEALKPLRQKLNDERKPPFATPSKVLDAVWGCNSQWYEGERSIFDQFWNARKLGRMMKSHASLVQKEVEGRLTWVYIFAQPDDEFDMKVALAYLRRIIGLIDADYWCILAALWLTTGRKKFPSEEALMTYWTRWKVGRTVRSLGFRAVRKTWKGETLKTYNMLRMIREELPERVKEILYDEAPRSKDLYVEMRYRFLTLEQETKKEAAREQQQEESATIME